MRRGGVSGLLLPLLLIVGGLIALLLNLHLLPADSLRRLSALWPLILVILGFELVLRSGNAGRAGRAVGVFLLGLAVVGSVLFVALGPAPAVGDGNVDRAETTDSAR